MRQSPQKIEILHPECGCFAVTEPHHTDNAVFILKRYPDIAAVLLDLFGVVKKALIEQRIIQEKSLAARRNFTRCAVIKKYGFGKTGLQKRIVKINRFEAREIFLYDVNG